MYFAPALRRTVTHQVREFLLSQEVKLKPWSRLDETYCALHTLLNDKKHDSEFWQPLTQLMKSIIDNAVDPNRPGRLPAPQAELLSSWDIDEIIRSLRDALPGTSSIRSDIFSLRCFADKLPATVLASFFLLGLAASGCDPMATDVEDSDTSDTGTGDTDIETWAEECELSGSTVLWSTLADANLSDHTKAELCDCFVNLSEYWKDGLTQLFENGTAEEVAEALQMMIACCDEDNGDFNSNPENFAETLLGGELCYYEPSADYKGVSFPE